jgi:hypothetical protein
MLLERQAAKLHPQEAELEIGRLGRDGMEH